MIRTLHRVRGASAIGASAPGQSGPFGVRPDEDDDQDDELPAAPVAGQPEGEPTP